MEYYLVILVFWVGMMYWLFWHRPVCKEWDKMLNKLIDEHSVIEISDHVVVFDNGVSVWIENKYDGYGNPYDPQIDVYPKMRTKKKLNKLVLEKQIYGLHQRMKTIN